jgi:large subunit ribosomal protein L30
MPKKTASKPLKVTQIKSTIGCPADQKATVRALGLKRINDSIEQVDNATVRGMIFKVKHLVKVEEL